MKKTTTKKIARTGIIASLYVALSLLVLPLASGAIQVRFGEAMTLLPLFFPEACLALFVGCVIVNIISGCALIEVFLGAMVTIVSAMLTYLIGKIVKSKPLRIAFGGSFPVLLNAFILPLIWFYCYGQIEYVYLFQALLIFLGQSVAVYGLGSLVYAGLEKAIVKNPELLK